MFLMLDQLCLMNALCNSPDRVVLIFLVLFYVFSILLITVLIVITVQMTFTRWPVGITAWYAIAMPCS